MGNSFFFYPLAFLAVFGALAVILARNPLYATLSLILTLFALSALFLLLSAPFVAMIQILVYAGAILVLFLFVVMLLDMAPEALLRMRAGTFRWIGFGVGSFFLWQLVRVIRATPSSALSASSATAVTGTTQAVGKLLFTTYALPFELASLLLLVGVIAAVVLAKKKL